MGKFFNPDSPLMGYLNQMADLVILNILTIVCCIPVVTIGAAMTALYETAGKLQREEGNLYSGYFRAFKSNFKQATALWLLFLLVGALLLFSIYFYSVVTVIGGQVLMSLSVMLFFLWAAAIAWLFPLQSRFANTIFGTLRNAFMFAVAYLPRSIAMVVLNLLPWVLLLFFTSVFYSVSIFWIVIGFALTAYTNLLLINKPFAAQIAKSQDEIME